MKCLPYESSKIKSSVNGNKYSWFNKDKKLHSFNDQPAEKFSHGSLSWAEEDYYFRKYNKPTHILISIKRLQFIDFNLNSYKPLTDEDVHPDYREQWLEWHQGSVK